MIHPPLAISLVTESVDPSGMGEHMLILAAGLAQRGHRVVVAAPTTGGALRLLERAAAMRLEVWPLADGDAERQAVTFGRLLESQPMHIVNVHAGIGWEGHNLVRAAAAGVAAVVRTEHLPYVLTAPEQRAQYEAALCDVDVVIAVSKGVAASHRAAGVAEDRVVTVQNGISDARMFTRRELAAVRNALSIAAGAPLLVTIGRLTAQKGYDVLLEAIPAVLDSNPATRFVLVGRGELEDDVRRAIADGGLEHAVTLLPETPSVAALIATADAVVQPSRFEGLPLVVLEAMAGGKPVVATRVCGTDEAVRDRETGFLVASEEPSELAAAIIEIIRNPPLARRLGANGQRVQREHFHASRMVGEAVVAYRGALILASRRTAARDASTFERRDGVLPIVQRLRGAVAERAT